ncbi:MAG: Glycogen synthase [Ignavibacteria bacterium ADurb.Bin266]|nr:MAG: Glycogen synthase [Ignavibacteria bacterium ADurb.Bin266]
MKPSDLFVFGYFGYVSNQLDGQTVKTRMIHRLLEENTGKKISYYDTELLKKNKLSLMVSLFRIIRAKHIIYLPAQNNLRNFFPILYFLSRIFNFKIHYFVVGGWLFDFVKQNNNIREKLKNIFQIYVETNQLIDLLVINYGFKNIIWFPNFRKDYQLEKKNNFNEKLRLIYLSRITIEKGIDTIFNFLDSLKRSNVYERVMMDFYGPVDNSNYDWFFNNLKKHPNCYYRGLLQPSEIQYKLCDYDLMIFPTRYPGEGCPGVIVEAYMASLPVIASDWKYNHEFVIDGKTGYLIKPLDNDAIKEIVVKLIQDRSLLQELSVNARSFSQKFTSDNAWKLIELK